MTLGKPKQGGKRRLMLREAVLVFLCGALPPQLATTAFANWGSLTELRFEPRKFGELNMSARQIIFELNRNTNEAGEYHTHSGDDFFVIQIRLPGRDVHDTIVSFRMTPNDRSRLVFECKEQIFVYRPPRHAAIAPPHLRFSCNNKEVGIYPIEDGIEVSDKAFHPWKPPRNDDGR